MLNLRGDDAQSGAEYSYFPGENITKLSSGYKLAAVSSYLTYREEYSEELSKDYLSYIKRQSSKLLMQYVSGRETELVIRLLATGMVSAAAIEKGLEAANANTEISAILLEHQAKYIDVQKEKAKKEQAAIKSLTHIETSTEQLKKSWVTKKRNDGTLTITNYKGTETVIAIPEQIGKSKICELAEYVFSPKAARCTNKEVREGITEISVPNTVSDIGSYCFSDCKKLSKITLPADLNRISSLAFFCCEALTQISIPNAVTHIDRWAFYHCGFDSITLPDGLRHVGDSAFSGCKNLTQVMLPASIEAIDGNPFSRCTSLQSINIDSENKIYESVDGVLYNKQTKSIVAYPAGKTGKAILKEDTVSIGEEAFNGCNKITELLLPESVQVIGYQAFGGCKKLALNTYDNAVYLGSRENPFKILVNAVSKKITSVVVHPSAQFICSLAFNECKKLETAAIESADTVVDDTAFTRWADVNLTIHAPAGSYAEEYAKKKYIPFEAI